MKRTPLSRKTRLRKVNPKRRKRLFQEDFGGGDYLAFIKSERCAMCFKPPSDTNIVVAAHTRTRGAGGKAHHVVPLCAEPCHRLYDEHKVPKWLRDHLRALAPQLYAFFHGRKLGAQQCQLSENTHD